MKPLPFLAVILLVAGCQTAPEPKPTSSLTMPGRGKLELSFKLNTETRNARVFVDGEPVGSPPPERVSVLPISLPAGKHQIRVEADSVNPREAVVPFETEILIFGDETVQYLDIPLHHVPKN